MTSSSGQKRLSEDMSTDFPSVTAVYVYNKTDTPDKPRVICISTSSSTHTWYKAGQTADGWTNADATFQGKNPDTAQPNPVTQSELEAATTNSNLTVEGPDYTIKLDKRPGAGSIKYRTKGTDVTVAKTSSNVPSGYTAYIHAASPAITGKNKIVFKHNGNKLTEVNVAAGQTVSKIFVYYSDNDGDHEFPLIVCVKKEGSSGQTYYKRGQRWERESTLDGVDPESPGTEGLTTLTNKLDRLKDKYEIDIKYTNTATGNTYTANAAGNQITVAKLEGNGNNGVPNGYIRYEHKPEDTKITVFTLGLVKYKDIPLSGIPAADLRES